MSSADPATAAPLPPPGPRVDATHVEFTLEDPGRRLTAVRLWQEVGLPADHLAMHRQGRAWRLRVPRPPVVRMEYLFEISHADGRRETVPDPGNPQRVATAFGAHSVLTFPGYAVPDWETTPAPAGQWEATEITDASLDLPVRAHVWTSPGLAAGDDAPLLAVHDGPEYDRLADLSRYLAVSVHTGRAPALRVALLDPGHRDEWYSANPRYAQALSGQVLPALRNRWPTACVIGMGTSLGALSWLHAQRCDPDLADGLFLQSGSFFLAATDPQEQWFPGFPAIVAAVLALHRADPPGRPVPTAMTCGCVEENLENNRRVARSLAEQGYPVTLTEVPDAHNYTAWRDAFAPHLADLITRVART